MQRLENKWALITGAASGIGRATAVALARRGTHVLLVDCDATGLANTRQQARDAGVEAVELACDLTDRQATANMVARAIDHSRGVDMLINNAGVAYYGPTVSMTAEQWDWLLRINLLAPIQITQALLPNMLERPEAHIVNICSIFGLVAGPRLTAYHTSKFGLVGFSASLRADLARSPVGVTAVCPGLVQTNIWQSAVQAGNRKEFTPPRWLSTTPERVAEKLITAIRRNRPLVVVTPLAHLLFAMQRISPTLLDRLIRLRRARRIASEVPSAGKLPAPSSEGAWA